MKAESPRKTAEGWIHQKSRRDVSPNLRWTSFKGHEACAINGHDTWLSRSFASGASAGPESTFPCGVKREP